MREPRASIGRSENIPLSTRAWFGRGIPRYTTEPRGIDLSSYQSVVDFDAPEWKRTEFLYMRGGLSWGTKDTRFDFNWAEARKRGMRRGAYFVLYPGEDPQRQVNFWLSILGDDMGELPPALDVELHHNQSPSQIAYAAYKCLDLLSEAYDGTCLIYSAKWFIDRYMGIQGWYNNYWWWLAGYLYANPITGFAEEHPGPVPLPMGVLQARCLIHQTAGKFNSAGFGVQSKNIDTNRWLPGLAHLQSFANDEPPPMTLEERVTALEDRVDALERAGVWQE